MRGKIIKEVACLHCQVIQLADLHLLAETDDPGAICAALLQAAADVVVQTAPGADSIERSKDAFAYHLAESGKAKAERKAAREAAAEQGGIEAAEPCPQGYSP